MCHTSTPAQDFLREVRRRSYGTILADPPWQFTNRTGQMAPEHRRLSRYTTLTLQAIKDIPISVVAAEQSHLYLWVPNALLHEGLEVREAWGFHYKKPHVAYDSQRWWPRRARRWVSLSQYTEIVLFGVR